MKHKAFKSAIFLSAGLFSLVSNAGDLFTTSVSLNVDSSVPGCTFDRTQADSYRVGDNTIMGAFSVHCKLGSKPFRMTTTLSPFASINLGDGSSQTVDWYVRKGGAACNNDEIHDDAILLHSGNRSDALITFEPRSVWSYCVQLSPKYNSSKKLKEPETWPLQGELHLSLTDIDGGFKVPDYASRMFVRFANNSSVISEEMVEMINTLFMNIGDPNQFEVQLHAHTSLIGDESYNRDLSVMRLKNVREYIVNNLGVKLSDTWGQAWGETRPGSLASKNKDEAYQNRRVDIVITPKK